MAAAFFALGIFFFFCGLALDVAPDPEEEEQ